MTMWCREHSVSCSVKDSVTVHAKEDDCLSEPCAPHMSTFWRWDWVSCQCPPDLHTSNISDVNVVNGSNKCKQKLIIIISEWMVRCERCNGKVPTDKICRKFSAILPCGAAANLFPVKKNEDDWYNNKDDRWEHMNGHFWGQFILPCIHFILIRYHICLRNSCSICRACYVLHAQFFSPQIVWSRSQF